MARMASAWAGSAMMLLSVISILRKRGSTLQRVSAASTFCGSDWSRRLFAEMFRATWIGAPLSRQRLIEQPVGQRADQTRALRHGDELRRPEESAARMIPAHQYFAARHEAGVHVHFRLVIQLQLVALDGAAQLHDQRELIGRAHFR